MRRRAHVRLGRSVTPRRAYGGGGLALPIDGEPPEEMRGAPPVSTFEPLDVRGPTSGGDYDGQPDHLLTDHNDGRMLDVEAEMGRDLHDLADEQMEPWAGSTFRSLPDAYQDMNSFDDGGGTELHMGHALARPRFMEAQAVARQPWVAVDLDNTLLAYEQGMAQRDEYGQPLQGAREALSELASLGWRITIYTARIGDDLDTSGAQQLAAHIGDVLNELNIPFDDVWVGRKPRADIFIDDRAVAFRGDWQDALRQVVEYGDSRELPVEMRGAGAHAGGALLDTTDSGNDFGSDGMGGPGNRRDLSVSRPPELEEVLY